MDSPCPSTPLCSPASAVRPYLSAFSARHVVSCLWRRSWERAFPPAHCTQLTEPLLRVMLLGRVGNAATGYGGHTGFLLRFRDDCRQGTDVLAHTASRGHVRTCPGRAPRLQAASRPSCLHTQCKEGVGGLTQSVPAQATPCHTPGWEAGAWFALSVRPLNKLC